MTISPYQQGIINYDFKPFQVNLDLVGKVLGTKQQEFNSAYSKLQNLKQEAINIKFLNKKSQKEIDRYNKDINTYFNSREGEFGDLSNSNVSNKHMDLFRQLGSNTKLINRYKYDTQLQQEHQKVLMKSRAKDPNKEGFHNMNYQNYKRRLNKYSETDLDEYSILNPGKTYNVKGYTNYIDLNKGAKEVSLEIPEEEFTRFIQDGKGGMIKETVKKRDVNKVKEAVSQYLISKGGTQLAEEAEYYHYQNKNNPQYHQQLYDESQNMLLSQKERIKRFKKTLPVTIENSVQIDNLNQKLIEIDKKLATPNEFVDMSDDNLIRYLTSVHSRDMEVKLSNSFGYENISQEWEADPVFWKAANLNRLYAKDKQDTAFKLADLDIKKQKLGLEIAEFRAKQLENQSNFTPSTQSIPTKRTRVEIGKEASNKIFKGIQHADTNLKDFFTLGISSNDLGVNEEDILKNINNINNSMSGLLGGKAGTSPENLKKYNKLRQDKLKLEEQLLVPKIETSRQWVNNIKNNFTHYDDTPVGSSPRILATKEAIRILKRTNKDLTPVNIIETAKKVLTDETSSAFKAEINLKNFKAGVNTHIVKSGIDNVPEEEKENQWNDYASNANIIPVDILTTNDYDLTALSPKQKAIVGSKITAVKNDLINSQIVGEIMPDREKLQHLNFGQLKRDDIISEQLAGDVFRKITFNSDLFKGPNNTVKGYYILGKDGVIQEITPEKPHVLIPGNNNDDFLQKMANTIPSIDDVSSVDKLPFRLTGKNISYKIYRSGEEVVIDMNDEKLVINNGVISGTYKGEDINIENSKLLNASDNTLLNFIEGL